MHNNYAAVRQLPTFAGSVLVLSSAHPAPDGMSTAKQDRQATILEVVSSHVVDSQEELRRLLRQRGWDVTQATLSRDLRELRLVRVPTAEGPRYAPAGGPPADAGEKAALEGLLPSLVIGVDASIVPKPIEAPYPPPPLLPLEDMPDACRTLTVTSCVLTNGVVA